MPNKGRSRWCSSRHREAVDAVEGDCSRSLKTLVPWTRRHAGYGIRGRDVRSVSMLGLLGGVEIVEIWTFGHWATAF